MLARLLRIPVKLARSIAIRHRDEAPMMIRACPFTPDARRGGSG